MTEDTQLLRTQTIAPLSEARERLSEIVDDVATTGADLVITKHGRPMAVVIGYDEYESLIETLNCLARNLSALSRVRDQHALAGLIG